MGNITSQARTMKPKTKKERHCRSHSEIGELSQFSSSTREAFKQGFVTWTLIAALVYSTITLSYFLNGGWETRRFLEMSYSVGFPWVFYSTRHGIEAFDLLAFVADLLVLVVLLGYPAILASGRLMLSGVFFKKVSLSLQVSVADLLFASLVLAAYFTARGIGRSVDWLIVDWAVFVASGLELWGVMRRKQSRFNIARVALASGPMFIAAAMLIDDGSHFWEIVLAYGIFQCVSVVLVVVAIAYWRHAVNC